MNQKEGMSLIVKTVTGCLKGFIFLFGIYIVIYGHLTPGGGFAGGVIVACAFILLTLAEGQRISFKSLRKAVASELDSVGALIFLGVALIGMFTAGVFFRNFLETAETSRFCLLSAGIIPICNIGIGLKVGMSLFLVFTIIAAVHVVVDKKGKREMVQQGRSR